MRALADPGCSEKLQLVPDQLDARISEKHFLSAVEILQEALGMIRKSDMDDIGALADLHSYFGNQEIVSQIHVMQVKLLIYSVIDRYND